MFGRYAHRRIKANGTDVLTRQTQKNAHTKKRLHRPRLADAVLVCPPTPIGRPMGVKGTALKRAAETSLRLSTLLIFLKALLRTVSFTA